MLKKVLLVSILSVFLAFPVFVLAEECDPNNDARECVLCEKCDIDEACSLDAPYCVGGDGIDNDKFGTCQVIDQLTICNPLSSIEFADIIDNIIGFIVDIAYFVAPLMVVVGGFLIITSSGDPKKLDQGKKIIIWTGVGFLIILLARGIVSIIDKIL